MKRIFHVLLVVAGAQLLLASSCEAPPPVQGTDAYDVNDLIPRMQVVSDGATLFVEVALDDTISGDRRALSGGDALTVTVDGVVTTLVYDPAPVGGITSPSIVYSARLLAPAKAVDVDVAFTRVTRPGAPRSTVYVPAPFEVLTSLPKAMTTGDKITTKLSRATGPDDGSARLHFLETRPIEHRCVEFDSNTSVATLEASPDGTLTADTRRVFFSNWEASYPVGESSPTCVATMNVELVSEGKLDPAFSTKSYSRYLAPYLEGVQRRGSEVTVAHGDP